MIIEIIKRTPPWVFFLFFVLLTIGVKQTKDRTVNEVQIIILPATMITLSLFGVFSAFGSWNMNAFTFWFIGVATAGIFFLIVRFPNGVTYSSEQKTYNLPGSWWPLTLMMILFFTKYAMGVINARKLPALNDQAFIAMISLSYGFISGLFLFRAYAIWRSKKTNTIKIFV